jgi:hypothetical protein
MTKIRPISELRELMEKPKEKRNKHNANKTIVDGIVFDSEMEAAYYVRFLNINKDRWHILKVHPHFDFIVNGEKIGKGAKFDFLCVKKDIASELKGMNALWVIDVKGRMTREWAKARDLMKACHGIDVTLVGVDELPRVQVKNLIEQAEIEGRLKSKGWVE